MVVAAAVKVHGQVDPSQLPEQSAPKRVFPPEISTHLAFDHSRLPSVINRPLAFLTLYLGSLSRRGGSCRCDEDVKSNRCGGTGARRELRWRVP